MNKAEKIALVVEDEWLVRMEIAEAFEGAGWDVLEAGSGEEAVALLPDGHIGLLVTDIRLSGPMNGWEVAEAFRARLPHIPVIYASANPAEQSRMVTDSVFLEKPSLTSDLIAASERLWQANR